jgi:hypothetical protein
MVVAIIPVLSFVAFVPALTAVGLGIAALVKRAAKGKALTGLILGAVAFFLAFAVSVATIGAIGAVGDSARVPLVGDEAAAPAPSAQADDGSVEDPAGGPAEEADEPEAVEQPPAVPDDKTYQGSGDSVVEIELPDGSGQAAVATIAHQGSSNFAVWALDSNMAQQDLLVNVIGNYQGTVLFNLSGNDTTSLEITADGAWSVTVRSLLSLEEFDGSPVSGSGDDVLIYRGKAGVAAITHNGSSNFAVWTYGDRTDLVVNEIGAYSGSVRWTAGPSVVAISADGEWSITVSWK